VSKYRRWKSVEHQIAQAFREAGWEEAKRNIEQFRSTSGRDLLNTELQPKYKNRDWLRDNYLVKGKTLEAIANECSCHKNTIYNFLKKFGLSGIKRGNSGSATVSCSWCGRQFTKPLSRVRRSERHYCSLQCRIAGQRGIKKNYPKRRKSRKQSFETRMKISLSRLARSGGISYSKDGYIKIYCPNHPYANGGRRGLYVYAHRLIMEQILGRYLTPDEVVHHKDGNPQNNDPANLVVMSKGEHRRVHPLPRDRYGRFCKHV